MDNIKFFYLYRDAGNFKKWAEIVFSNPEGLAPVAITTALRRAFLEGDLFLADQVFTPKDMLPPTIIASMNLMRFR